MRVPAWAWLLGSAAIGLLIGYALSRALSRTPRRKLRENKRETKRTKRKAIEAIWESDDEVRRNIPADLVPVFNRIKRQVKSDKRRSRTETFLEWVEAHPDDVVAVQAELAEQDVARAIAEHERELAEQAEREAEEAWREPEEPAEPEPDYPELAEEPPEAEAEADWSEYRAWEKTRAPEHAQEDISDEEFFRRLPAAPKAPSRRPGRARKRPSGPARPRAPKRLAVPHKGAQKPRAA